MGPPTAAIVPAGQCVFTTEWSSAPLVSKVSVSHDTRVLTFGLPDGKPLGLSTCACILAKAPGGQCVDVEGKDVVRPYTPISTNALVGQFQLMIKVYAEGNLSQFFDKMEVGQPADFKHVDKNVKVQYPFKPRVGMLVGGTGITPMLQALHAILGSAGDSAKVGMVYGSRTVTDILAQQTLEEWARAFPEQLTVDHVLSAEPERSGWTGGRGFVTREHVVKALPPPSDDCIIFVCGPPPMYDALCGPRDVPALTGLLADMGYSAEQVVKF